MSEKLTYEELEQKVKALKKEVVELRRIEKSQRETEERIIQRSSVPTFVIDNEHNITHWNRACENLTGISANEIVGTRNQWMAFYPAKIPSMADFIVENASGKEMAVHYADKCRESAVIDGAYEAEDFFPAIGEKGRWLFFTAAPLKDEKGKIIGAIETLQDISDRKQTEAKLIQTQKRFRDLVENSITGISIIQNDQVVYQNPVQEKLLGPLPRKTKLVEIESIYPDDIGKVAAFYRSMTSKMVQTQETDFRFYPPEKRGTNLDLKWVQCQASSIEYQGKDAILVNMMDITRAKELETFLRTQDKMSSLGRVAAGIAHEIRNPLSGINIYLNTLEKLYDKEESLGKVKQILRQLQSASNKIESVIRKVMDFSKPSTPRLVLTGINQPVEDAIGLSSVTLRKRGIQIEKDLAEDLPMVHADPQLIEQVILNLITNAAEAMKNVDGAKQIKVTSSVENNRILVRTSDSGPGVPLNLRGKVFDPFYTTKTESTGIGLSLCHRIITDHDGSLTVSESKWGGAKFTIEMPIKEHPGIGY